MILRRRCGIRRRTVANTIASGTFGIWSVLVRLLPAVAKFLERVEQIHAIMRVCFGINLMHVGACGRFRNEKLVLQLGIRVLLFPVSRGFAHSRILL